MNKAFKSLGLDFRNFLFFQSMNIGRLFAKYFLKGSYLKDLNRILNDISKKGYAKINQYYLPEEIESINKLVNRILDDNVNDFPGKVYIERDSGFIKINPPLTQKYKLFKRYSFDYLFLIISLFFYRSIKIPSCLITIKHDGSFVHPIVPGERDNTRGKYDPFYLPHIDYSEHYLKGLILLEDVSIENGPTGMICGSTRDKLFRDFYIKNYPKISNGSNNPDKPVVEIIENVMPTFLTGKKGDLIFFDSSNIHWGSALTKGSRKILWLYF